MINHEYLSTQFFHPSFLLTFTPTLTPLNLPNYLGRSTDNNHTLLLLSPNVTIIVSSTLTMFVKLPVLVLLAATAIQCLAAPTADADELSVREPKRRPGLDRYPKCGAPICKRGSLPAQHL